MNQETADIISLCKSYIVVEQTVLDPIVDKLSVLIRSRYPTIKEDDVDGWVCELINSEDVDDVNRTLDRIDKIYTKDKTRWGCVNASPIFDESTFTTDPNRTVCFNPITKTFTVGAITDEELAAQREMISKLENTYLHDKFKNLAENTGKPNPNAIGPANSNAKVEYLNNEVEI